MAGKTYYRLKGMDQGSIKTYGHAFPVSSRKCLNTRQTEATSRGSGDCTEIQGVFSILFIV